VAGKRKTRGTEGFASVATLLPVIVGALLMAIVGIFLFEAPNQITTPGDTGYLNAEMPAVTTQIPTAAG
jgi:hypothetical protein